MREICGPRSVLGIGIWKVEERHTPKQDDIDGQKRTKREWKAKRLRTRNRTTRRVVYHQARKAEGTRIGSRYRSSCAECEIDEPIRAGIDHVPGIYKLRNTDRRKGSANARTTYLKCSRCVILGHRGGKCA